MKEITRIHLAQTPYNIELAAKKELEKYLNAITKALGADDDALREIEARIIELLMERGVTGDKVITLADVAAVEVQLGKPGDFVDEDAVAEEPKKRFMRDEQGGMIGGVLAGLAAYTGVDVVWWRIAAVVLGLASFGTAMLVYVVLWIVMPPARTAAERLQMRGETPTLERIKAEASTLTERAADTKKPLVIMLRVLGVLLLGGVALGTVAAMIFGGFVGAAALSSVWWLMNPWLVATLAVAAGAAALFVALLGVAMYALGAWRMTKAIASTMVSIIVVGILLAGIGTGTAFYGVQNYQRTVDAHTQTQRTELSDLKDAKQVHIADTAAFVEYHTTTDVPYAEVQVLQQDKTKHMPVTVERSGDSATVKVDGIKSGDCDEWLSGCAVEYSVVKIYGPALESVTTGDVSLRYHAKEQTSLHMELGAHAIASLRGRVDAFEVKLAEQTRFDAQNAALRDVQVTVDQATSVELGTVATLNVIAPGVCGEGSDVSYERADIVTVNGAPATGKELACIELESNL